MGAPRYIGFDKGSIDFLAQLAANNDREWFAQNKARYEEQVLDVALRFIQSMQDPLEQIAPHFTAVPQRVGGSPACTQGSGSAPVREICCKRPDGTAHLPPWE